MLRNFPFTIVPLVIFNLVILFTEATVWDNEILKLPLFSGQDWPLRVGDLMVIVGLLALMGEVFRATSMAKSAVTNHLLSIIVLIVYVIEFVVVGDAANSTFFILTIVALIDVLTGVVVTLRLATRDIAFGDHLTPPN
ncbi:MAG: hypothetical protein KIT43_02555 [Bauldia sp.]|nr:hypothetical protein [Bauldia sp.]MCW5718631.1 hypothetical protein [Bauldia sp.]